MFDCCWVSTFSSVVLLVFSDMHECRHGNKQLWECFYGGKSTRRFTLESDMTENHDLFTKKILHYCNVKLWGDINKIVLKYLYIDILRLFNCCHLLCRRIKNIQKGVFTCQKQKLGLEMPPCAFSGRTDCICCVMHQAALPAALRCVWYAVWNCRCFLVHTDSSSAVCLCVCVLACHLRWCVGEGCRRVCDLSRGTAARGHHSQTAVPLHLPQKVTDTITRSQIWITSCYIISGFF